MMDVLTPLDGLKSLMVETTEKRLENGVNTRRQQSVCNQQKVDDPFFSTETIDKKREDNREYNAALVGLMNTLNQGKDSFVGRKLMLPDSWVEDSRKLIKKDSFDDEREAQQQLRRGSTYAALRFSMIKEKAGGMFDMGSGPLE